MEAAELPGIEVKPPPARKIKGKPWREHKQGGVQRSYTDAERVAGLAEVAMCHGSVTLASRRCGVPETTLYQWKKRDTPLYEQIRHEKREQIFGGLAESLQQMAAAGLEQAHKGLPDASYRDAMVGVGIATQRSNELLGSVQSHVHLHTVVPRQQLDVEIEKAAAKLAAIDVEAEEIAE